MQKKFVMRGQTDSGKTEVLNFSGYKPGYAYRLTKLELYPSTSIHDQDYEIMASITAGKTAIAPTDVDFNSAGLIATAFQANSPATSAPSGLDYVSIVNDTFLITQNLILMVQDSNGNPINWQCRFETVKMSGPEEAAANYKQFTISDGS